jgi:SAM-dependent methyltransferase
VTATAGATHRRCPVCGADDSVACWHKAGFTVVHCARCGMRYTNPVPDQFGGSYYADRGGSFYLAADKLAADYASVRFERELRLFREFVPRGRVLDVGCSSGAFLFQLRQRGDYDVIGTDVATGALDHAASRGIPVIRESFLEHDFGPQRFAAVTFWAVLEHVLDPAAFLRRAADLVEPGGHVFALVPNARSLATRLLGAKYRYVLTEHVNYFDRASLTTLGGRCPGLEVVAVRTTHFNPVVLWQDWRRGGQPVPDAERIALLKQTTGWKQSRSLAWVRPLYRAAEAALGTCGLADNLAVVWRRR